MTHSGLADVWHLLLAILARQNPFVQIMTAEGAVLFVLMAIEGVRTSLNEILNAARSDRTLLSAQSVPSIEANPRHFAASPTATANPELIAPPKPLRALYAGHRPAPQKFRPKAVMRRKARVNPRAFTKTRLTDGRRNS